MLAWIVNLGDAASDADTPLPEPAINRENTFLMLGTGCWIAPLIVGVLLWTL